MKGFKNTTRTQYSMGGDVSGYAMGGYAKGGTAKGAAKVAKVMGEFKRGELHSGSKDGPKVTKPAQAKAIAMSEARKAPMKKNEGGKVGKMPPLGESVKSGNRMSKMTAAERLAMEARFGEKKRPSPGDSVKSGNRIAKEEAAEARHLGVFKEGGKVRKYAEGGPVEPVMKRVRDLPVDVTMPPSRSQVSTAEMTPEQFLKFQYEQERAIHSDPSSPFHSMYFPKMEPAPLKMMERMEPQMPQVMPPVDFEMRRRPQVMPPMMSEPMMPPMMSEPTPPPRGLSGLALEGLKNASIMKEPPMPLQNLGQVLQRIQQKQPPVDRGFIDRMPRMNVPEGPPPAGMAPVNPNQAMMMKHGGRAAMSKGKR
jgi:hypothetical protein